MITPLKQSDPRWGHLRMGNSSATLSRYGCYVMALCEALEKLRGYPCDPRDAIKYWDFDERGMLLPSTEFEGMKIIKKASYYDLKEVAEYANDPNKVAILQLNHGRHFVYVDKVEDGEITYAESIDGQFHDFSESRYQEKTGMRLYEATAIPTPEWMEKFIEKAKERGMSVTDIFEEMTIKRFEKILFEMGIVKKVEGHITLGRMLVIMQKIKELY